MDEALNGTRQEWARAIVVMVAIVVVVGVIVSLSPDPVEAHIAGRIAQAAPAETSGFEVLVTRADGPEAALAQGAPLAVGDTVRFRVTPSVPSYVAVIALTRDALALAPTKGRLTRVEPGAGKVLGDGTLLDAAMLPVRFVAVICKRSMNLDRVVTAAREALERAAGELDRVERLELDCEQRVVYATNAAN